VRQQETLTCIVADLQQTEQPGDTPSCEKASLQAPPTAQRMTTGRIMA